MNTEKLHLAYDKLKGKFEGSFHAALWRVCVDNILDGKMGCFVHNYNAVGLQLGIAVANESGYIPCPVYFKDGNYTNANKVLAELTEIIFGLKEEACMQIITTSMRGKGKAPLCQCNNCDVVLIDKNPKSGAVEYELKGNELEMTYENDESDDPGTGYWACPKCNEDGGLQDEITIAEY